MKDCFIKIENFLGYFLFFPKNTCYNSLKIFYHKYLEVFMKKIHQLSFRMQIFLSSLILVIFPTVLLSTINAISKTSTITSEYNTSTAATLTQMNQSLDTLLETSDIVSVHAPLNEHTEHLMNLNAFCKMKKRRRSS